MIYLRSLVVVLLFFAVALDAAAQEEESVARKWNEALLHAVRNDFARPTVHARNLWHTSVVMYDAWAAYDDVSAPYFLGNEVGGYQVPFNGVTLPEDVEAAREEAISYAAYRLLMHRFQFSPGAETSLARFDSLMNALGYDPVYASTDYENGPPAALGNYIADHMINFGFQDGANELGDYSNLYYLPVNDPLDMTMPGNPAIEDPNRWQPLEVPEFIDQGGNPFTDTPPFLSPEWGNVVPFALHDSVKTTYEREGDEYHVYHDPGPPPFIDTLGSRENDAAYRWGFSLVAIWQSHHDPEDGVMWDVSPASIGNVQYLPQSFDEYYDFYDLENGGDPGTGHDINPATGQPYTPQIVPRSDYTRILAEFWADGPDSETPPGHWFTILNYVSDHPDLEKRWRGVGPVLDDLEWDVKSYFALGGAMHDCAIAAWGVKGWYDFLRPVSALRFMADKGQSTDPDLPSFHPAGIPLRDGLIELVDENDPLAGLEGQNVGKIKLYTWRGPDYIEYTDEGIGLNDAGVGWILAENWWPYQRPTFVTPPFAGYVSGHSTYSRAAAEILTLMTGDEYFPGGMGEFQAPQNEFLVFEEGPSMDVTLQWATYRDASDQCSLSRIWGGIHPPCDDIPGRIIGMKVGINTFDHANDYIEQGLPRVTQVTPSVAAVNAAMVGETFSIAVDFDQEMDTSADPDWSFTQDNPWNTLALTGTSWVDSDTWQADFEVMQSEDELMEIDLEIWGALNLEAQPSVLHLEEDLMVIDMVAPQAEMIASSELLINEALDGTEIHIDVFFSEAMSDVEPALSFQPEAVNATLIIQGGEWLTSDQYRATYSVEDIDLQLLTSNLLVANAQDIAGNWMIEGSIDSQIHIDMKAPQISLVLPSVNPVTEAQAGPNGFSVLFIFDEEMSDTPCTVILSPGSVSTALTENSAQWVNPFNLQVSYNVVADGPLNTTADVSIIEGTDLAGNTMDLTEFIDAFEVIFNITSVGELEEISIEIYPNPVAQGEPITLVSDHTINEWRLFTNEGKLVKSGGLINAGSSYAIESSGLSAGSYLLHLRTNAGSVVQRVVVN